MTEIRFTSSEYDQSIYGLQSLAGKLITITNDSAVNNFGDNAVLDPTDIEVTPTFIDQPLFVVNAWHETGQSEYRGIMQMHDYTFRVLLEGLDAYVITEDERMYPTSTIETLFLMRLANIAIDAHFSAEPR